jgi:hypothetical protein
VQAAIVLLPRRVGRPARRAWIGVTLPAVALAIGVLALRLLSGGPHALALVAAIATPLLAAARPKRAPAAAVLWLVAWLADGLLAQAASIALIALAAVTVAEAAGAFAPKWSLAVGLVALAILDVVLVWGTSQVGPATTALHHAAVPAAAGHSIPRLQDATFGSATMGWLDFAAAALLGVIARARVRAAVVTGVAAGAWGLLLLITTTIPATVPAIAGLLVGKL